MTAPRFDYVMGMRQSEYERLIRQGRFFRPFTEHVFRLAGILPGFRVLDVGCGVGDVALLLRHLVGESGEVVGLDQDGAALERAQRRVMEAGFSNIRFVQGDYRDARLGSKFDAAVGRLTLMYQPDPAAALRAIVQHVRTGGVVAFQEMDFTNYPQTVPHLELYREAGMRIIETFRRAGVHIQMGMQLHQTFVAAGLPAPVMRLDVPLGRAPETAAMAEVTQSLLEPMEKFGIATRAQIQPETLAQRLFDAASAADAVVMFPALVGAWSRT